jgi:hypothetical protein
VKNIGRWRIALVASALVVLGALGAGLVLANDPSGKIPAAGSPAGTSPSAGAGDRLGLPGLGLPGQGLLGFGDPGAGPAGGTGAAQPDARPRLPGRGQRLQRIIHVEATLDLPAKGIVTVALDHGTISAIDDGTISVKEKNGRTVTVKTADETKVRKAGEPATLGDLKVGDEVVVMSRLEDGSFEAYRIVVPPAQPASTN